MPTATRARFCLPGAVLLAVLFAACDTTPGPSLYDPIEGGEYQAKPDPQLTGIAPDPSEALAGVTELTLTGQNFNPSPDSTFVYFNGVRYPVLSISPTEIKMRAPNLPMDGIQVKVSVLRAENFSQVVTYALLPAVERVGDLDNGERPFAVATDPATSRIFASMLLNGIDVVNVADLEARETAVPVSFQMADMDFANDYLYVVRNLNAVFRHQVPNGSQEVVGVVSDRSVSLLAVEYDDDDFTWVGGSKSSAGPRFLYRFDANRAVTTFPFEGTIRGIESTPGFLYVLAERNGQSGVWRFSRTAGELGAEEQVFVLSGDYAGTVARSFALTADGGFLLGTDNDNPLLRVQPNGEVTELLEGLLSGTIVSMAWLPDGRLVISNAAAVGNSDSEAVGTDVLLVTTLLSPQL